MSRSRRRPLTTWTGRIPVFPSELIDYIIDNLHDDDASLASCILVSRSWVPTSRLHLWDAVAIAHDFEGFKDFLAENPHVCPFIHKLTLYGEDDLAATKHAELRPRLHLTTFTYLLSMLDCLRTVNIYAVQFITCSSSVPYEDYFELDRLEVYNSGNDEELFSVILDFLRPFSQIGHLHFSHVIWADYHPNFEESIPTHLQISSISLDPDPEETLLMDLFESLIATQSVHTLRHVEVHKSDHSELSSLWGLLKEVGPNLRHLSIKVDGSTDPMEIHRLGDLEANSNLRNLEANYSFVQDATKDRKGCEALLELISLAPSSLREVNLQLRAVHPNDLWAQDVMDWARVELVLSRFEKLESVIFDFDYTVVDGDGHGDCSPEDVDMARSLDSKAPLLAAKGITYLKLNSVMFKLRKDVDSESPQTQAPA